MLGLKVIKPANALESLPAMKQSHYGRDSKPTSGLLADEEEKRPVSLLKIESLL